MAPRDHNAWMGCRGAMLRAPVVVSRYALRGRRVFWFVQRTCWSSVPRLAGLSRAANMLDQLPKLISGSKDQRSRLLSPQPRPLPRGEGESFFVARAIEPRDWRDGRERNEIVRVLFPLPAGEGQGEGEDDRKIAFRNTHWKVIMANMLKHELQQLSCAEIKTLMQQQNFLTTDEHGFTRIQKQ
jgi:hypothetical protein